jgi:hypothetical protein
VVALGQRRVVASAVDGLVSGTPSLGRADPA